MSHWRPQVVREGTHCHCHSAGPVPASRHGTHLGAGCPVSIHSFPNKHCPKPQSPHPHHPFSSVQPPGNLLRRPPSSAVLRSLVPGFQWLPMESAFSQSASCLLPPLPSHQSLASAAGCCLAFQACPQAQIGPMSKLAAAAAAAVAASFSL